MFDIRFISGPEVSEGRAIAWGRITLGSMREDFEAPLESWTTAEYERQWLAAATRLVGGAACVVFLTHMTHPEAAYHLGWPAWRDGAEVYVQERLFLIEQLTGPFDPARPERHAGSREEISAEGQPISQWRVRLEDVAAYLQRR